MFDLDYYGSITIAQLEGGSKYTFWNSMLISGPNVAPQIKMHNQISLLTSHRNVHFRKFSKLS